MIRLPPSIICLAPGDLLDYEDRRQQRELENIKQQFARFEVGARDGPKFGRSGKSRNSSQAGVSIRAGRYGMFGGADSSVDLSGSRIASPENIQLEVQQSSSPPKDAFQYGGFIESPSRSSPFAPDDVSTPQELPTARGRTLPRSPLYLSHNALSSPERRPTSSLTPRVASRVANHNTPGYIFSQPARRGATFRHQTNSFSFDSSERASATYEQDRISSLSTTRTTSRPTLGVRLRDELRGSSLSSSLVSTDIDASYSEEENEFGERLLILPEDTERRFIFSSPQLPAPFSTTPRNVSNAESLPSGDSTPRNHRSDRLSNSRRRSPTDQLPVLSNSYPWDPTAPSPRVSEHNPMIPGASSVRSPSTSPNHSTGMSGSRSPNHSRRPSPMTFLRSGAARIVSYYRPRSPSRSERLQSLLAQTPSRSLTVYNDDLPPATQPQTPAHLPESRHQSRYHQAYTAPVTRGRSGFLSVPRPTTTIEHRAPATPSRATRDRAGSPAGLRSSGFQGLYGGRENGDEEQDWVEGVRFTNAEVRLWGVRDAIGDGRSLRDTPEREEWHIGRH